MRKIKREGVRKLHQAMNGVALGHGVYGKAAMGQIGNEMSLKITIRLYQSIFLIVLIDLHLCSFVCQCKTMGFYSSPQMPP